MIPSIISKFADTMNCDQSTIIHLHSIGKLQKLDVWVAYALKDTSKQLRANIAWRHRFVIQNCRLFMWRIITDGEKWCLYVKNKGIGNS